MPSIVIMDYGSGNLRSVERALLRVGADVEVTADHKAAVEADGLVVPGVGAFSACMDGLLSVGGEEMIDARLADGRPVLGICVGMQILFDRGVEHGVTTIGTAQWQGTVERLDAEILPHMGWNTVRFAEDSRLFAGLSAETRFYFVHSYAVREWEGHGGPSSDIASLSWSKHGGEFVAAVESGALSATQFHPEKSGEAGAVLLRNWLHTL